MIDCIIASPECFTVSKADTGDAKSAINADSIVAFLHPLPPKLLNFRIGLGASRCQLTIVPLRCLVILPKQSLVQQNSIIINLSLRVEAQRTTIVLLH